jgi:hypothetical protein
MKRRFQNRSARFLIVALGAALLAGGALVSSTIAGGASADPNNFFQNANGTSTNVNGKVTTDTGQNAFYISVTFPKTAGQAVNNCSSPQGQCIPGAPNGASSFEVKMNPPGPSATFTAQTAQPVACDAQPEKAPSYDNATYKPEKRVTSSEKPLSSGNSCVAATTTAPRLCKCVLLTARIVPKTIAFVNPGELGGMHLEFTIFWTMNCLPGAGGCKGTLDLVPPVGPGYSSYFKKPGGARINCKNNCDGLTQGTKDFVLVGNRGLGGDRRGVKPVPAKAGKRAKPGVESITILVKRTCQGKRTAPTKLVLVFDRHTALVDKKKSKFK